MAISTEVLTEISVDAVPTLPKCLEEDPNVRFSSEIDVDSLGFTESELSRVYEGALEAGRSVSEWRNTSGLFGFELSTGNNPNEYQVIHRGVGGQESVLAGVRCEATPTGATQIVLFEARRLN